MHLYYETGLRLLLKSSQNMENITEGVQSEYKLPFVEVPVLILIIIVGKYE